MDYRTITLIHGVPEYAARLAQITGDVELVTRMWADAETKPEELDVPGIRWSIALVEHRGREVPAAWAAARVEGDILKCICNYEHPRWRGHGLYEAAYRHRHATVVASSRLAGLTYIFRQPLGLHEADGWVRTGLTGTSREAGEPHDWWELRRDPR